jgi:hypothetical protein
MLLLLLLLLLLLPAVGQHIDRVCHIYVMHTVSYSIIADRSYHTRAINCARLVSSVTLRSDGAPAHVGRW